MIKGNFDALMGSVVPAEREVFEVIERNPLIQEQEQEVPEPVPAGVARPSVDFSGVLEKAMELFKEQAQMGTDGKVMGLAELQLSEARANSFLNSINNALSVSHLANIAEAEDTRFKRRDEMAVYNPLLSSFATASRSVERKINYVARQMDRTVDVLENYEAEGVYLDSLGSVDILIKGGGGKKGSWDKPTEQNWEKEDEGVSAEVSSFSEREYVNKYGEVKEFEPGKKPTELMLHLDGLQYLFDKSLGNMSTITSSIDKLVQSERYSGARSWGNSRAGIPVIVQPTNAGKLLNRFEKEGQRALGNGGISSGGSIEGNVVREIGMDELGDILLRQQKVG